jgi:predicted transposase YbfD/YdcC
MDSLAEDRQQGRVVDVVKTSFDVTLDEPFHQPHLYEDIGRAFDEVLEDGEPGVDFTICQTEGIRGGRQETRTCCVITNPSGIRDMGLWTELTAICMVTSERVINGVPSHEVRYFIGSVAGTAEEYLRWVRGHWGIENSCHWIPDVCSREDDQRHWAGHSASNLSWLRKLALCLLEAEPTSQARSINRRRHLAGWKDDYLLKVLALIPEKCDA